MRPARAALFLATALSCAAADRVPSEYFPPNTRMVIGISLRSLLDSPLLQSAGGGAALLPPGPFGGIDLKELDHIVIASEGGTSNAPSIAVIRGRFRLDASKAARHGGLPIFEDRKGALALLDDNTALAGSLADVKAAIDRRGGAPALSPDLAARIDAVSDDDFWAVGDVPEGVKPKSPAANGLDTIDRFDFGASLRNGLQLRGAIRLRSAQDAAQLATAIRMFGAMFQANPAQSGAKFDLKADGNTIRIDLSIPDAELKKAVAAQRSVLTGMLQGGMPAAFGGLSPSLAASRPAPRAAAPPPAPVRAAAPASAAPARVPWSFTPSEPATIVTNEKGETVQVTLPGGK